MVGEKLTVEILGRPYEIDAEGLTPIEANFLAQFVSDRMAEVQSQTGVVDSSKLAVLTALNLADELWRLKRKSDQMSETLTRKFGDILRLLENAVSAK